MSRTYKWAQLSRAQQDAARGVRAQLWAEGLSATVSQIARHYDEAMAYARGELSAAEFGRLVDAVAIQPPGAGADSARRALAEWAANDRRRDDVVRAALAAGVTKTEVHELTGIARTTIDRITGGEGSRHEFTPWKFGTEYAPQRWVRWCATCPQERPHCEVSGSAQPPESALAEMEPWERTLYGREES